MALPGFESGNRAPSSFREGSLLDEFFRDIEDDFFGGGLGRFGNTDIYEKDGSLHYEIEFPGITKDDIKIQVKGDQLVVTGEVKQEEEEETIDVEIE